MRSVHGVGISAGIRVRLSLAPESLLLRRPSYIRVGDYSNIKAASIGSQRPQPSLHAMMQTPRYDYRSRTPFRRSSYTYPTKKPPTPSKQPLKPPSSTMLFWRWSPWGMILEEVFQVCAWCATLRWGGQIEAAVAGMHCQTPGTESPKRRVCASAWR